MQTVTTAQSRFFLGISGKERVMMIIENKNLLRFNDCTYMLARRPTSRTKQRTCHH
jgi:hypothetical protein